MRGEQHARLSLNVLRFSLPWYKVFLNPLQGIPAWSSRNI